MERGWYPSAQAKARAYAYQSTTEKITPARRAHPCLTTPTPPYEGGEIPTNEVS